MVKRNMSNAVMRGIVVPPGSKAHITRKRIASEPKHGRTIPLAIIRKTGCCRSGNVLRLRSVPMGGPNSEAFVLI
jgi:hypothetical protein